MLLKAGKLILSIQLMTKGLAMRFGIKLVSNSASRTASHPVEVGYSTFLDLVNVNGKEHMPGKKPTLELSNMVISKDRLGFKIVTDEEKQEGVLQDKKLVKEKNVSMHLISLSKKSIYTMKPPASQYLINTLRKHEVPFHAASTEVSNKIANAARLGIFAFYLIFLQKINQMVSKRGGEGRFGDPKKLAMFLSGKPLVKFKDIEGIDDAKFEVMELVDTLRNPKKYEILCARGLTGFLLERPPGAGECNVLCLLTAQIRRHLTQISWMI